MDNKNCYNINCNVPFNTYCNQIFKNLITNIKVFINISYTLKSKYWHYQNGFQILHEVQLQVYIINVFLITERILNIGKLLINIGKLLINIGKLLINIGELLIHIGKLVNLFV